MPYRRLPNTDAARVRALSRVLELSKKYEPDMLAFKQSTLIKVQAFLPNFEQARMMQKEAKDRQVSNSKEFVESFKKAKLYISHFLQVLNMTIIRGELKPSVRKFYGIGEKDTRIPELNTEKDVVEWGRKVIKGENERVMKTGNPILSPRIAVVSVYYDKFLEKLNFQKNASKHQFKSQQQNFVDASRMRQTRISSVERSRSLLRIRNSRPQTSTSRSIWRNIRLPT